MYNKVIAILHYTLGVNTTITGGNAAGCKGVSLLITGNEYQVVLK